MSGAGKTLRRAFVQVIPTGASMKVSISYKYVHSHQSVEQETGRSVSKLSKLLKSYDEDLVQLHGVFSRNAHNHSEEEHAFALTLSLPNATLHATGTGANVRASCKKAFSDLESQVKKHQSRLRHDHEWKRNRLRIRAEAIS
jgi:ribosomal subunit interface protein